MQSVRSVLRRFPPVRFNHVRVAQLADSENKEQTMSRLRSFTSSPETKAAPAAQAAPAGVVSPAEYRKREDITLRMPVGVPPIDPVQTFDTAPEAIQKCSELLAKFPAPTSIQAQAWPIALAGHDLVSIARTGSGKTLGFLIPVFNHISKLPRPTTRGYGPIAIILAPTRELAQQIEAEAKNYSNYPLLCAFGGVSKGPQVQKLRMGVDIIVATPGRLNDLLSMDFPATNLNRCSFVVLDEADRMLDMGFEPQLRAILDHMKDNKRQTLMFSATWPKEVRELAMDFLDNAAQINIGGTELNVCPDVSQTLHQTHSGRDKADMLTRSLKSIWEKEERKSIMIFCNTKLGAEQVAEYIKDNFGKRAHTLHGDKSQDQRDWALSEFRTGKAHVIVCTDVAARGIDIKNVGCVINYDFPSSGVQDWIHRVGRTGRSGAKGEAITFFSSTMDTRYAGELATILSKAQQEVPGWLSAMNERMPSSMPPQRSSRGYNARGGGQSGGAFAGFRNNAANMHRKMERDVRTNYGFGGNYGKAPETYEQPQQRLRPLRRIGRDD